MDAYTDKGALAAYEDEERGNQRKWAPTWKEMKLLFIASTGFFIDAYG